MSQLVVIVLAVALAVFLVVAAVRLRGPQLARAAGAACVGGAVLAVLLAAVAFARRTPDPVPQPEDAPLVAPEEEYTASTACRACHPEQYATWRRSYHRTMTQRATPEAVVGDFSGDPLQFGSDWFRVFEVDGSFYGEMRAPGTSARQARRVTVPFRQTTGSHHMQLYWYPAGKGRSLALFPIVYLVQEDRWLPRRAGFLGPPHAPLPSAALWNRVCVECHTTRGRPRLGGELVDTQVGELGIACEACHGPGGPHVEANRSPLRRYRMHLDDEPDPTIVDPSDLPHDRSAQVCGQCHASKTLLDRAHVADWFANGSTFRPGDDLETSVNLLSKQNLAERPALRELLDLEPELFRSTFWPDGVIRVSGREYSAVRESACFTRGEMSCVSCHQLHKSRDDPRSVEEWANDQLAPGMDGNAACTGCHPAYERSPALEAHTRHAPGSSGSACQNCHMPYTTYGLLKAIRDHKVASPDLRAEVEWGRPNACNQCHLDRPLGWTAEELARGWGMESPGLSDDDFTVAAGVRWALQGDAGLRALAAWSMGWKEARAASGTGWMAPYLLELLDDPYDAVRIIAKRSIDTLPGFEGLADDAYDELGSASKRREQVAALRVENESRPATDGGGRGPHTLFDAQGRLETDTFDRLLRGRDLRPLELLE